MARTTKRHKVNTLNTILILLASVVTLYVTFYLSKSWADGLSLWLHMIPYYAWALLPYAVLLWWNKKYSGNFSQAMVILVFAIVIIIFGCIGYTYAYVMNLQPYLNMTMLVIPLFQFIAAVIAFPVLYLFRKHRSNRI